MQRIIYQTRDGGVAVIIPSQEALDIYGIQAIALKDVPEGVKFKIVDVSEIPTDRAFRNAWEVDMTTYDGVGSALKLFQGVA